MKRLALAAALALVAGASAAQPPTQGSVGKFSASILCDTQEQLQSIVDALGESTAAAEQRFRELYRRVNQRNEPTCAVVALTAVATDTTHLGLIDLGKGKAYGWIVRVATGAGEGYYLYLESRIKALKNSI